MNGRMDVREAVKKAKESIVTIFAGENIRDPRLEENQVYGGTTYLESNHQLCSTVVSTPPEHRTNFQDRSCR